MITKKYSKINIQNFFPFVYDVLKANKTEELLSFLIWELLWKFFRKNIKQIKFINDVSDLIISRGLTNMQLGSCTNIQECSVGFNLVYIDTRNRIWGSRRNALSKLFCKNTNGDILECFDFDAVIEGVFLDSKENIFVCSGGMIFRSGDQGLTFRKVLNFSSDESIFLFDSITETENNEILIGEYANIMKNDKWLFVGYIYMSDNGGETWQKFDFLKKHINKHIHILKWIDQLKCLVLTEGDNKKGIWINKSRNYSLQSNNTNAGWCKLNNFHIQKGGYTSLVETEKGIILGTDYYHGTNFIVVTSDFKIFNSFTIPDPYRKSAIFRMLYLQNKTVWASLYNHLSPNKSLLMYSKDFGKTWRKFLEYDGAQMKISIVSNSSKDQFYILIQDLLLNEFKTYVISSNSNGET